MAWINTKGRYAHKYKTNPVNPVEKNSMTKLPTYKGKIIDVYQEEVTLPNGHKTILDLARHPGASAIVPMLDDGRIVLIKQYRHAVGGYIYEVPAGKLDNNEAPEDCAKRELIEEIGYRAGQLEKLISIHTTPGFCNEMIHIYLATELQKDQVNHEPNEVIEIEYFTKIEIKEMINSGKITDAKTLVGLLYALQN